MTKSLGIGRGGARPGSGRKPKQRAPDGPRTLKVESDLVAHKSDGSVDLSQTSINVLFEIAMTSVKDTARVTAARDILKHMRLADPLGYIKARADAKKRNADDSPLDQSPRDAADDKLFGLLN